MNENMRGLRYLLLALCVVLGIMTAGSVIGSEDLASALPAAAVFGVLILVLSVVYVVTSIRDHLRPLPITYGDLTLEPVDKVLLDYFVDRTGLRALGLPQLFGFVDPILFPNQAFDRISESVESFHRSNVVRTTFTVGLNYMSTVPRNEAEAKATGSTERLIAEAVDDSQSDFVVPLLVPLRGELVDGLQVEEGGKRISTLSAQRQLIYSMAVMRGLVYFLGKRAFDGYVKNVEPEFELSMREMSALPLARVEQLCEMFASLPKRKDAEDALLDVVDLARALLMLSPVCVPFSATRVKDKVWPRSFRISVSRRAISIVKDAPGATKRDRLGSLLDGLRLGLGINLNSIYFPLLNASRANSYHLEVIGREGTYLAAQGIIPGEADSADGLVIDARMQPRNGQRRAHLYVRALEDDNGAHFATHFFERAPGSFLLTTLSAFAAALIVTLLAFRESADWADNSNNLALLPALLAVPIGVAALSGLEGHRSIRHPSLMSRGLTFIPIALGLTAILAVSLPGIEGDALRRIWEALIVTSWATFTASAASWVIRLVVEYRLRTQDSES